MTDEKKRYRVIVDVYPTEDGEDIYSVDMARGANGELERPRIPCPLLTSGFFREESDLDEWLADHAAQIEIVRDYRKD